MQAFFQYLVKPFVDLVRALVVLDQAPADLVQVLVHLVQAHLSQRGLISVGCSGARFGVDWICLVCVWERGKQVCNSQVVRGLGVGCMLN